MYSLLRSNCTNNIDETLLNRCLYEYPPSLFTFVGDIIQPFVNPRGIAVTVTILLLALPIVVKYSKTIHISPASYFALKISLLHFLYRCCYSLVLDVALYTVFRQSRPCTCSFNDQKARRIGSVYGMPSGDSMMGALVGAFIWDSSSSFELRAAGVGIMISVMCERMSWGFHSLAQTMTGSAMGIILHYWSTRMPLYFTILESMLILPGGFALLMSDPARSDWSVPSVLQPGFQDNLLAWFCWGVAFQLFAAILICRHYCSLGILSRMRYSIQTTLRALELQGDPLQGSSSQRDLIGAVGSIDSSSSSRNPLLQDANGWMQQGDIHNGRHFSESTTGSARELTLLLDTSFTFLVAGLCCSLFLLQDGVARYGWIAYHASY